MSLEKELRIGNWVRLSKDWEGKYKPKYQINAVSHGCPVLETTEFGVGVIDWKDIEPIPLTEEWLERFGINEYNIINDKIYIHREDDYFQVSEDGFYRCSTEIKYVHQLQNLYHALRGEEIDG